MKLGAGDLERIVRENTGVLLRGALALGVPESDAEELVQETFTAFLGAAARFEGRSTVRTFLFGILYRKALERGRKRSKELAVDPADALFERRFTDAGHWRQMPAGPERHVDAEEAAMLIGECLDALPEQQRAAFVLKEIEQEAPAAVCNALDVSDTHLRVLLFRARNALRNCLEKKWAV